MKMNIDIPCSGLSYVGEVVENDRFFEDSMPAVFGNMVEEELFFDDRTPTVAPIIITIDTIIPTTPSPSNILYRFDIFLSFSCDSFSSSFFSVFLVLIKCEAEEIEPESLLMLLIL